MSEMSYLQSEKMSETVMLAFADQEKKMKLVLSITSNVSYCRDSEIKVALSIAVENKK